MSRLPKTLPLVVALLALAAPVAGAQETAPSTAQAAGASTPASPVVVLCFEDAEPRPVYPGETTSPAEPEMGSPTGTERLLVIVDDGATGAIPVAAGGLVIESTGTSTRDAMSFWYDSTNARVRLSHREAPDAPVRVVDLSYPEVVEFRDTNGDGAYDEGEPIVQRFEVPKLVGKARTSSGSCGIRLTWTYALAPAAEVNARIDRMDDAGVGDGKTDAEIQAERDAYFGALPHLTLRFTHVGAPRPLEAGGVTPDRVKIDVGLERFPFREAGTLAGVRSAIASDLPQQAEAGRLATASATPVGYSWADEALLDGATTAPVGVTILDGATPRSHEVVFAYPASERVHHDPELGVFRTQGLAETIARLPGGSAGAFAVGALAAVAILAGIAIARRR